MKPSGAIVFWSGAIAALLLVEVAELTHLFTLPVESVIGNLVSFIFALVFTTILALVGALFIGIYISQRLTLPGGFTPFEEEMLKMRSDVQRIADELAELRGKVAGAPGSMPAAPDPPAGEGATDSPPARKEP